MTTFASLSVFAVAAIAQSSAAAPAADTTGCRVSGAAPVAMQQRAVAACRRARERMAELFEYAPALVHMGMTASAFDHDFVIQADSLLFYVPAAPTTDTQTDRVFEAWEEVAPHEIAHGLFAIRTGELHQYGENRGDWFMEAVAIWAESDPDRARRFQQAAGPYRAALTLTQVLRMRHPLHAENGGPERGTVRTVVTTCSGICNGRPATLIIRTVIRPDGTQTVDTLPPDTPVLEENALGIAFYALSITVLTFIHERAGPVAVRLLEQRIRAGDGADAVLGLPGLPATLDEFERQWSDWLETKTREPAPSSQRDPPQRQPAVTAAFGRRRSSA